MSKNTNIADLINYISIDGSGNLVLTTGGQVATQSYVTTAISNLVNAAPSTLDTLKELATALGNDANFATTVTNSIATKLPLTGGTLTGALSGTSATFSSTLRVNGMVGSVNLFNLYKPDNTTLGGQLAYDSSINQLYLWNNISTGFFSIYLNGTERFKIAADSSISLNGSTTVKQNFKVLGDTYTSVEFSDGGTGDPGYVYVYYNGTRYFSIGANDTYFNYGNVAIGSTVADNTYQGLTIVGSNPSLRLKTTGGSGWVWTEYVTSAGVNNFSVGVNQTLPYFGIKAGAGMDSPHFAVLSNGNVCIGTTSDSGHKFNVNGQTNISGTLFVSSNTDASARFKGDTAFDGGNRVYITNNAYIYGRNNLIMTGRLDANNDGYSFGTNCRNSIVFSVNEGGAQGAEGTPYFSLQLQGLTKAFHIQSAGNNSNSREGWTFFQSGNASFGSNSDLGYKFNVVGSIRSNRVVYNWYSGAWQGNGTYWHMKTNLYAGGAGNTQYTMSYFKGYSYSYSAHILEGAIGFHNWSGSLFNVRTNGNLFTTAYVSSDGYVVLVVPSGNGESGITIDWHQHWDYPFISAIVTAAGLHGATTGKY